MKGFYYNPEKNNDHPKAWCTGKFTRYSRELGDTSIVCINAADCPKYANFHWVHNDHPGSIYDFPIVTFKTAEEFLDCKYYRQQSQENE